MDILVSKGKRPGTTLLRVASPNPEEPGAKLAVSITVDQCLHYAEVTTNNVSRTQTRQAAEVAKLAEVAVVQAVGVKDIAAFLTSKLKGHNFIPDLAQ